MLQEALDLGIDEPWRVAAGFGGGMGGCQDVCGAVSGAIIAIGYQTRKRPADQKDATAAARAKTREMYRAVESQFGCVDCRTLVGVDFEEPGAQQAFRDAGGRDRVCKKVIEHVVRSLVPD